MNFSNPIQIVILLETLKRKRKVKFQHTSNSEELSAMTEMLRVEKLKAFIFNGHLIQSNKTTCTLEASFQATVMQNCIISLNPVKTVIHRKISQSYFITDQLSTLREEGKKIQTISTDFNSADIDEISEEINIGNILFEALSFEIPLYPKKKGVIFEGITATKAGIGPLEQNRNSPFDALKKLK